MKNFLVFFKNYRNFFKFINWEGKAYGELIERREEPKTKYSTENAKLTAKKEKLFSREILVNLS